MYTTTELAKQAALRSLLREQESKGRIVSPWVRSAVLKQLPAKELSR